MSIVTRVLAGILVTVAIGIPILETWETLLLAVAWLAIVFGAPAAITWRRAAATVVVVAAVVGVKAVLPRADIAEAHNAFMVVRPGDPLERSLPAEVFQSWKAQFDALYPPMSVPDENRAQWRTVNQMPTELFVWSADSSWRRPKYTRQVDAISFASLGEFRGGFANDLRYNFWKGDLLREQMPFYVMYELTSASVGSALAWQGQLFWERASGGFEDVRHEQVASRAITPSDAGKHVYALFLPKRDALLHVELMPSWTLSVSRWLESLLNVVAVVAVLALTIRPRWRAFGRAGLLFGGAYAIMAGFLAISAGKYLGKAYPPQGGGDDGLSHDGFGHTMARLASQGDVVEALRGIESVYWSTPGTRYLRMLEKLVFGDTNHLFALLVACTPIVIFHLIWHFAGRRMAWIVTAIFCIMPVGNLSLLQYMANAKLGYGEATACALFMLAFVLLLRVEPSWGGTTRSPGAAALAGAALAGSMFMRPNFAIAVVWVAAAFTWASWRRRDVAVIAGLGAGLALALWMPFHNLYYGGEFHFISSSSAVALPVGVADYAAAAIDLARGQSGSAAVALTSKQLSGWLLEPGFLVREALRPAAWAAHVVKLVAFALTFVVVLWPRARPAATGQAMGVLAVAALCVHAPMLFTVSTHYRYAMLGWELSLVVLIGWAVGMRRERVR